MAPVREMKDSLVAQQEKLSELVVQAETLIEKLSEIGTNSDGLAAAAQLGRLDLVTFLFGIVGVLLIFGGLFAFGYVKGESYSVAKKTAEDIAEKRLADLIGEMRDEFENIKKLRDRTDQPSSTPAVANPRKATAAKEMSDNGKG